MDAYENNELAQERGIYEDQLWEEVKRLRDEGKDAEANGLVMTIRWKYVKGGY